MTVLVEKSKTVILFFILQCLKNIEERVAGMGGQCKIISIANQGTIIEIKIPQKQEKE